MYHQGEYLSRAVDLADLRRDLQTHPKALEAWLFYGIKRSIEGNHQDAVRAFEQVIKFAEFASADYTYEQNLILYEEIG